MDKFIPVKITDRQWAEKLLDGEVFMRPLHEFGSWNRNKEDAVNNDFRGDVHEGTAAVFYDTKQCELINGLPDQFQESILQAYFVDGGDPQFFKIFSLYCMEYDQGKNFFKKPDPRMKEFGNTAVIIRDFNEFIERFGIALFKKYEHVISMIDRVNFYKFSDTRSTNPLFDKIDNYSYQKELRMALCELERDRFARGPGADTAMRIVEDLEPLKLEIGDIRDIAVALPIDDFLNLKFPDDIKLHFPMRDIGEEPSNFDGLIQWTREQMKNYRTLYGKYTFVVG